MKLRKQPASGGITPGPNPMGHPATKGLRASAPSQVAETQVMHWDAAGKSANHPGSHCCTPA